MKINEVFDTSMSTLDTSDTFVLEAARFGRREAGVVMRNSELFKIGIEYEFDVTEGENAVEDMIDSIIGTKEEAAVNSFILAAAENIEAIATDYDINDYRDELREAADGNDVAAIDSFFQFSYGDLKERLQDYRKIQIQAKQYASSIKSLSRSIWYGRGFPTQTYNGQPISLPALEDADYEMVIAHFGTEEVLKSFLNALLEETEKMIDYAAIDCDKIYGDTVAEIINSVNDAVQAERKRIEASAEPKRTKIDVVKENLPIDRQLIAGIVPDPTVPNGVEVVTKPLTLRQTFDVMKKMFNYIDRVGGTSKSTGLHVNLSIKNFDKQNFNATKAVVLLDPDAYQTGRKYPMRDKMFLDSLFNVLQREDILANLAKSYIKGGDYVLMRRFEKLVEITSEKMRSVNLAHFFDEDTKVKDRRIEFRFVGGKNYHTRFDEITNDIGHMCYVMLAGTSEDFLKKEYYRGVLRLLDRAVKITTKGELERFSELIDIAKKKM